MSKTKTWDKITLDDLLRVDPFDQQIYIHDPIVRKNFPLVQDNREFFTQIYADISNKELEIIDGSGYSSRNINIHKLIDEISYADNSLVVFIEGYAGCGKSTFVQYLLANQLKTFNYNYNYYNYDIGSYYDNTKSSRIVDAIRECFIQQLNECIINNEIQTLNKFQFLLSQYEIRYLDTSQKIFNEFVNTTAYSDALSFLQKDKNTNAFRSALYKLLKDFSCEQIMSLDYIFRLARYIESNHINSMLYVCYDNLDSIENFEQLSIFDNTLTSFRKNLDDYINATMVNYQNIPLPHFIIFATYRKITATKVELTHHSERGDDFPEYNQYIYHIDISHIYSFNEIIKKRKKYFSDYIARRQLSRKDLIEALSVSNDLTKMDFVHNKYAGLWNNNYRTCSSILNRIFHDHKATAQKCNALNVDGYDETNYTYYGASAIFLGVVCKVFNAGGLWGKNHLNLIPLNKSKEGKEACELTSLARLILTYMANATDSEGNRRAVCVTEIFDEFSKLFSPEDICRCLSNMLARDKTDTWRRPIYYHRNAINDDKNIESVLMNQLQSHLYSQGHAVTAYTELMLCECGYAYIERLMSDFEFFSNRLSNQNESIYILSDINKIRTTIDNVYNAVSNCCCDMVAFSKIYMQVNKINSYERYTQLPIHPRTRNNNPQLHTERIIFSHIAYLDKCRLYHLNTISDFEEKKLYNSMFVEYISKYLSLYSKHIQPISSDRINRYKALYSKVEEIKNSKNEEILFQIISETISNR